jgi:maltose alpha-D-glucosyltransferase/alpha-amylase
MQWSSARNAGFSTADRDQLVLPIVNRGPFGYRHVNVADQHRDPSSLLHFVRRAVAARRELRELTLGEWEPLRLRQASVFAIRYRTDDGQLVAVHNLARSQTRIGGLELDGYVDAFANRHYGPARRTLTLDGYGYRWLRPPDAP